MYEFDFLPVGDGDKSGDAIAVRFTLPDGWDEQEYVCVVDGGFLDDGQALVDHIGKYYGTNHVNLVVSSHSDSDHINGLSTVISKLEVDELMMHRPWLHNSDIARSFTGSRVTNLAMPEALRKSLESAQTLEQLAIAKGIPITDPLAGVSRFGGALTVVGP